MTAHNLNKTIILTPNFDKNTINTHDLNTDINVKNKDIMPTGFSGQARA